MTDHQRPLPYVPDNAVASNYLASPQVPASGSSPGEQWNAQPSVENPTLVVSRVGGLQQITPALASGAGNAHHRDQLPNHHLSPTDNGPHTTRAKDVDEDDDGVTQEEIDQLITKDKNKRIVIVHGIVHDVTLFAPHHPGGSSVFVSGNGKDMSITFDAMHGPGAKAKLQKWAVGKYLKDGRPKKRAVAPATATGAATGAGAEGSSAAMTSPPLASLAPVEQEVTVDVVRARIRQDPKALLLILFGDVYDITKFAREHPGGTRVLESSNGKECGETFMRIHGFRARDMVKRYYVGHLQNAPPCVSPLRSAPAEPAGSNRQPDVSSARMHAQSTRLLEVETLPTSSQYRYLTFASPYRMNVPPGGHIKVYSNVDRAEGRFYTPYKTELASFSLCVKHYPHGRTTSYLFNLREGDEVFYDGPFAPAWSADKDAALMDAHVPNADKHVLLLAGGTGVTPLFTIARDLLQRQMAHVTLLFAVENRERLLLDNELAQLESKYNVSGECCFTVFVAFSQSFSSAEAVSAAKAGPAAAEDHHGLVLTKTNTLYGKIDAKMLRRLPLPRTTQAVVVCGPPSFNEAMIRCVVDAAVCKEKQVHVL